MEKEGARKKREMGIGRAQKSLVEAEVEAEAGGGEELSWEKLLARTPVSVLLVEPDDSTSQIIAMLLQKCGYRVAIAFDGMEARAIMNEKDHNIDLVLTEVELPKMSGVSLLTMMMTHESCKRIPVIMMSSNDSISIAFKCMIKGAADFLVKPIRRNELTNLWQHVWRRQKGKNHAIQRKNLNFDNECHSLENVTDEQDDMDFNEKESDAQSSCTRLDMEVESTCTIPDKIELEHAQQRNMALFDATTKPHNHFEKQSNAKPFFLNCETNGFVPIGSNIQVRSYQQRHISSSENFSGESSNTILGDIDLENKRSCIPSLQLSLESYPHITPRRQGNDELNTLNHSNSSAFSLYNNRCKVAPTMSMQAFFQDQNKESCNSYTEPATPYQFSTKPLHYENGLVSKSDNTSLKEGTTFRCTPIRFIPYTVPQGRMSFDLTGSNPFIQSTLYPQSNSSMWSAMPETYMKLFSYQSDIMDDLKPVQSPPSEDFSLKNQNFQSHHLGQVEDAELVDEQRVVSAVSGDSASTCNDNRQSSSKTGSTDLCNQRIGRLVATTLNNSGASTRSGDEDCFQMLGLNASADASRLSQREAALIKFRLKRKERCFEKKVRYLSRKKLAEQRPRVKGQFVRQV